MKRAVVWGVWLAVLCTVEARAQDWSWAEGLPVQSVLWEGLERVNPGEAASLIATRPGDPFSGDTLTEDLGRLYRSGRFGSPGPGQAPVSVEVVRRGGGVVVVFTVHERGRVLQVVFEGLDDVIEEDELAELIRTESGALHDPFQVERDVRALRRELERQGRLTAEVRAEVSESPEGVTVVFAVFAGPQLYVDEIQFQGAQQLDPSVLLEAKGPDAFETEPRALFGILEEGLYDPVAFDRDLDRVSRYYRSQGFLDVQVYKLEERLALDGEALTLILQIEEGPRYRVRRVGIEGARVLSEDQLLEDLELRPGRPFLGQDLQASVRRIKRKYGQRAYIHAEVDIDVRYDPDRPLLDVTLRVIEGPRVRVDTIRIEGNDKTQEEVIRRELSIYPGQYFDSSEIETSLGRLGRLRYFQDLRIDFEPGSAPDRETLVLEVEEARTGSFIIGGGVSTNAGFFANISLVQRNFDLTDIPSSLQDFLEGRSFTGAGQTLSITLQPGRERSQYSIEFTEPYLFGYPVIFGVELSALDRIREDWLEQRLTARFTLGYRLTQDLFVRAQYRIERVFVSDIEFDAVPDVIQVRGENFVSAIRFSLELNKNLLDRDFVQYGGFGSSVYYEYAGLGGDHFFNRAGGEANWQTPIWRWPNHHKWVFGLRGQVDWQREARKDDTPIFERFFAGGPNSLRGFRFRTVTPQLRNKPLGGDFRVLGTAEFSFPLFRDVLRGVLFLDSGGVTSDIGEWNSGQVRVAAGFGFRLKVPLFPAPVALDFGWPLKRQREDDRQVFSFSVGFGF